MLIYLFCADGTQAASAGRRHLSHHSNSVDNILIWLKIFTFLLLKEGLLLQNREKILQFSPLTEAEVLSVFLFKIIITSECSKNAMMFSINPVFFMLYSHLAITWCSSLSKQRNYLIMVSKLDKWGWNWVSQVNESYILTF